MLLAARPTSAHIEMSKPPPRGSKYGPDKTHIDYNLSSPTHAICQGKPAGPIVGTYKAGSFIDVVLSGTATHNGGHCQFSLSYDGGKTFVVIKDVLNNCLIANNTYSVQIPATAPGCKNAIFAWSWINASGVREYYMNCADIAIEGTPDGNVTGPKMLVANILGGPTIPEWGTGTDKVGVGLLAGRENITITSSGSSTSNDGNNSMALQPTPVPAPAPESSYPTTPDSPSSSAPAPPNDQAPSGAPAPSVLAPSPDVHPVPAPKPSYPTYKSPEPISSPDTEPSSTPESAPAPAPEPTPSPVPTSSYPTTNSTGNDNNNNSTITSQDSESSTPAPAPTGSTPVSIDGSCKPGEYRCIDSSQFTVCGAGGYLHTMKCALGTECVSSDNTIRCDHAKQTNITKPAEYN
jgi:hypothetical protein